MKSWLKWGGSICLLFLGGSFCALLYQAQKIASPQRREIQEYHRSWLDSPELHGMKIRRVVCCEGKVPTLVVEPVVEGMLGKRGVIVRRQLEKDGAALPQVGTIIGNMVLLHGRNGRKEDLLPVAERYTAAGFRCILPDLPAHGESVLETVHFGALSWESELPKSVLIECAERLDFSAEPCGLWGMSMGGSFATHAAKKDEWASLTIVCSFDRLNHVLENQSQIASPIVANACQFFGGVNPKLVMPVEWAKEVKEPTLVLHGDEDGLIPDKLGKELYKHFASEEKRWISVEGGSHQSILVTPQPVYAEMVEWALWYIER